MTKKILKVFICSVATLCLLCSSMTVFAENDDLDFEFNIQPEEPTTQLETVPTETEEETQQVTEKQTTEEETEKETEKTTKKPTKPHTTEEEDEPVYNNDPVNNGNNGAQANDETVEEESTVEGSTDETLPDGAFYVYLERNNGQRRLKTIMKAPGYVSEPAEPVRDGYVFAGWYSDANFKNPWNFLTDKAQKQMTIYAKWVADSNTVEFDIIVEKTDGGTLEVNPQKASVGEPVVITVTPDEGKRLVQGSILINGEPSDFLSFVMPKGRVTISASFEEIPENDGAEEKSKLPLFIGAVVIVVAIIAVAIIIAKRRNDFNADLDPDEELYIDEDDEDNWIDESIVVEDGFKEGKKVVESVEPDYGTPDSEENNKT